MQGEEMNDMFARGPTYSPTKLGFSSEVISNACANVILSQYHPLIPSQIN